MQGGCVNERIPIKKMVKMGKGRILVIGKVMLLKCLTGFTCESWDTQLEREWWMYLVRQARG